MLEVQQRMLALFPAVNEQLMRIPGVVRVGVGMKETGGGMTTTPAWTVHVERKKAPEEIPPDEMVPSEIAGFPTDVKIHHISTPEEDDGKYRPVRGGIQIERAGSDEVGTLGCLGHLDTPEHEVVLLTNAHVVGVAANDPAGLSGSNVNSIELGQPTHIKSCCCTCNDIAVTLHAVRSGGLDFAIAKLKSGVQSNAVIEEIGPIAGIAMAMMGETVKKRGRTTGLTTGTISDLFPHGTAVITEILVKKNGGNERFSMPGDSGSALLNARNEIIGLHYKGHNTEDVVPPHFDSTSQPIQLVLDRAQTNGFAFTITTGGGGESGEISSVLAASADVLWAVELRLRQTEAGRQLWELVERHQREVLHLVNHVRAVTVVWQRSEGPTYLAAVGRSLKEPIYRIPREVNRVSREQFVAAVAAALGAHGSERLRTDLAEHGALLGDVLLGCDTAEEMFRAWEEAAAPAVKE